MDHHHVKVGLSSKRYGYCSNNNQQHIKEETMALRKGPWTVEEDFTLINYVALHGEGRWNSLADNAGLKRTGKSCRLRWLNYLRPDVRRGNITLEEQLLILELHSRWGNRWSKIAQHLPGRTDNEIKNYWRTRVQKHAKQLKCDVNSKQFKDTLRYLWTPRLIEKIQAAKIPSNSCSEVAQQPGPSPDINGLESFQLPSNNNNNNNSNQRTSFVSENSSKAPLFNLSDGCYEYLVNQISSIYPDYYQVNHSNRLCYEDFQAMDQQNIQLWMESDDIFENLGNINEDLWPFEK